MSNQQHDVNSPPLADIEPAELPVIYDLSTTTLVLDVSNSASDPRPEELAVNGDHVLVCFGGHDGRQCSLSRRLRPGQQHGVIFMVARRSARGSAYVRRFRQLVDSDTTVQVVTRET